MNVPEPSLFSNLFDGCERPVEGVLEQMATVKRHHWYQVGEAKKDVDPHQPEKEVDHEHNSIHPKNTPQAIISGTQHALFHRVHRYTLQLEGYNHDTEQMDRGVNRLHNRTTFEPW